MIGALLCLAVALLSWPVARERAADAGRIGPVGGRAWPAFAAGSGRCGPRALVLVACLTAAVAAALSTVLVGCLAGVCTGLALRAWQRRRGQDRAADALLALAELLGALGAELRSGRPLAGAIDAAVGACGDEQCRRVAGPALRAAGSGAAAPDPGAGVQPALAECLARVVAAVRLSSRTGCSLAAVLGAVEDDLRARHRHLLEVRTATAGPRASATVLAGLPVLALAMGGGVGADPWGVLTGTAPGQGLLVAGVALELAGVAWSARLVGRVVR